MNRVSVRFYEKIEDEKLRFAVIVSTYNGKWVWCRHRDRNTYEIPGGHREAGESITQTAKRELYEETGAKVFEITPVCVYSVVREPEESENKNEEETFGMLYYAEITELERELHSEIEQIRLFDDVPEALTYPRIQPELFRRVLSDETIKIGRRI